MEIEEYQKMYEIVETHWWYRSRTLILRDILERINKEGKKLTILDLATAVGNNFKNFDRVGRLYGLDNSLESIKYCKNKGIKRIILADGMTIPFKDKTFDFVIASDALEHFDDDIKALVEIRRVLKENGYFVATVPAMKLLWSPHDEAVHHHRRYTTKELASKLDKSRFTVHFVNYWTTFLLPLVFLFRKVKSTIMKDNPKSDFYLSLPLVANRIFEFIQRSEIYLLFKGLRFPFGVSIFCLAEKTTDEPKR